MVDVPFSAYGSSNCVSTNSILKMNSFPDYYRNLYLIRNNFVQWKAIWHWHYYCQFKWTDISFAFLLSESRSYSYLQMFLSRHFLQFRNHFRFFVAKRKDCLILVCSLVWVFMWPLLDSTPETSALQWIKISFPTKPI